jgi:hypothetical protein
METKVLFDHERLEVYRDAIAFAAWMGLLKRITDRDYEKA